MGKGLLLRLKVLKFPGDKTGFLKALPAGIVILPVPQGQGLFLTEILQGARSGVKCLQGRGCAFPQLHRAAVKVQNLRPETRVLKPQRLVLGMNVYK